LKPANISTAFYHRMRFVFGVLAWQSPMPRDEKLITFVRKVIKIAV